MRILSIAICLLLTTAAARAETTCDDLGNWIRRVTTFSGSAGN